MPKKQVHMALPPGSGAGAATKGAGPGPKEIAEKCAIASKCAAKCGKGKVSGPEIAAALSALVSVSKCMTKTVETLANEVWIEANTFAPGDVATICRCLATLNHPADFSDAFKSLGSRCLEKLSDFSDADLCQVAWAFAVRDMPHKLLDPKSPVWKSLASRSKNLGPDDLAALHPVALWRKEIGSEPEWDAIAPNLRQRCKTAYTMAEQRRRAAVAASKDETYREALLQLLKSADAGRAGLRASVGSGSELDSAAASIATIGYVPDVVVRGPAEGEECYVEILGPSQLNDLKDDGGGNAATAKSVKKQQKETNAAEAVNGHAVIKHRQLRFHNHIVVVLTWREWEVRKAKPEFMLSWLRKRMRDEREAHIASRHAEARERAIGSWHRAMTRVRKKIPMSFHRAVATSMHASYASHKTRAAPPPSPDAHGHRGRRRFSSLGRSMGKSLKKLVHAGHVHRRHGSSDDHQHV